MLLFFSNLGKDLIRCPDLDDLPAPHQREPVTDIPDKVHVMGNNNKGLIHLVAGMQDGVLHILFGDRVHGAGRFIKDHKTRFPDEHLRKRDPVPLPVRKLAREPVQDLPGFLLGKSCHPERDNRFS